MAIPRPTQQELVNRLYTRFTNETNVTAPLEGTAIGTMVKLAAAEIDAVWAYVEEVAAQSNISTATGFSLDQLGLLLGVPRKQASKATTTGQTPSIRFTNLGGTSVNIPVGTRVYKNSDPSVAFFTTTGATIAAGATADVHATASSPGQNYNVAIGDLTQHSAPYTYVSVTNILPIVNGSLTESDDSYRQRLIQEFQRRNSLTPDNTIAMLRSVDGVKDVLLLNYARGAGTFDCIVLPYDTVQGGDVVSVCETLLAQAAPVGVDYKIKQPTYRELDVTISVRFLNNAPNPESVRNTIRAIISANIDGLTLEDGTGRGGIYPIQLQNSASTVDPSIVDVALSASLDGLPLSNGNLINLNVGDQLVLRSLIVK